MSSFVVWSFWIPLHNSNAGVIAFAVFYGIFSGAVIALTPALVAQIRYVHIVKWFHVSHTYTSSHPIFTCALMQDLRRHLHLYSANKTE